MRLIKRARLGMIIVLLVSVCLFLVFAFMQFIEEVSSVGVFLGQGTVCSCYYFLYFIPFRFFPIALPRFDHFLTLVLHNHQHHNPIVVGVFLALLCLGISVFCIIRSRRWWAYRSNGNRIHSLVR